MKSPGAPSHRREVERAFWVEVARGPSSENAATAVGVSPVVGARWFRHRGGMSPFTLAPMTGPGGAHLPQLAWFGGYSVEVQDTDPSSTLNFYRKALAARRLLQSDERLDWSAADADRTGTGSVLRFERPGGWVCVTNFGATPVPLPAGREVLASGPIGADLPADTTAWVVVDESRQTRLDLQETGRAR